MDERNFRSHYYEKVGFRGVEEKKSLEILLKEKPYDILKLKQFCLRFPVPGIYRCLVWKILLGIMPTYLNQHQWAMSQRQMQFQDLQRALEAMGHITEKTPVAEKLLLMWLLESRNLHYDYRSQLQEPRKKQMLAIISSMLQMFENEVDCYCLAKGLIKQVAKHVQDEKKMRDVFKTKLAFEDSQVYSHLNSLGALDALPLGVWFGQCFANILEETALERIWDKLIGGSCIILVHVAVALVIHLRRAMLTCHTVEDVNKNLTNISTESAEVLVNKAVELWQQHGGPSSSNLSEHAVGSHRK